MNKRDLILAQKALAAREVKSIKLLQSLKTNDGTSRRSSKMEMHSRSSNNLNNSYSNYNSNGHNNDEPDSLSQSFSSSVSSLPDIYSSSPDKLQQQLHHSTRKLFTPEPKLSQASNAMVSDLSNRSITSRASYRKLQDRVAKEVKQRGTQRRAQSQQQSRHCQRSPSRGYLSFANDDVSLDGSVDSYGSFAGSLAGSVNTIEEESDSDYFIPKVCILRADGASLSDIYRSKQQDTWGKIVKAQYKEEQYMNTLKKKQKEYDNDRFGTLLKQQINENNNRIKAETTQNNVFAKLEDERAKRTEDLQKKRTQDAINRHKQFIANALEDMETKRKQKEQEMIKDMMENTRMINKDNQSVVQEHEKKKRMMEYNRQYQERLYQENLDAIARKERQKREYAEEIKRIDQENERQFQREQQRRQQEFNNKMAKSTEGPAHHIVNQITEQKRQKELAYEQYLISKENGLSSQLLLSETKAKQRAESNAHGLSDEWERNKIIKEKKKKDDEERNRKILQTMKEMLDRQEREDIEKRVRKRKENLKYQQDLDQQLAEVRQRSVNSLQKTMSEAERQYNAALIAKMAQFETI